MSYYKKKVKITNDVLITYIDGKRELFKAIQITKNGIITGRIMNDGEFKAGGFIAKNNIKTIIKNIK